MEKQKKKHGKRYCTFKRLGTKKLQLQKNIDAIIMKLAMEENERIADGFRNLFENFENEKREIEKRIEQENSQLREVKVYTDIYFKMLLKVRTLLECGSYEQKRGLVEIFLNKVLVFHDRIEIYVNTLPNAFWERFKSKLAQNRSRNCATWMTI